LCNGQLLSIQQNAALFALLGTTYGGDGVRTFGLPNFQGRVPVHMDGVLPIGSMGGEEAHTLTVAEMPQHTHTLSGLAGPRTVAAPAGAVLATGDIYGIGPPDAALLSVAVATTGGSQPHSNLQPYLTLNFCIALVGIFPSRN
jgi:microcystin-dependent protein